MWQDDPLDGVPTKMRAVIESFIDRIVETATKDANQALSAAGLAATVTPVRDGHCIDLIVRSSLSGKDQRLSGTDQRRAEDIADAVLQSVLIKASGNQRMLH